MFGHWVQCKTCADRWLAAVRKKRSAAALRSCCNSTVRLIPRCTARTSEGERCILYANHDRIHEAIDGITKEFVYFTSLFPDVER